MSETRLGDFLLTLDHLNRQPRLRLMIKIRLWFLCCFGILVAPKLDDLKRQPDEPVEDQSQSQFSKQVANACEMSYSEEVFSSCGRNL